MTFFSFCCVERRYSMVVRRHMRLFLYLTLVCVYIFLLAPVHAQNRAEVIMKNSDADRDGRISRKEWKGPPPRFDHFDKDGDGYLTLDELNAGFASTGAPKTFQKPGQATPDKRTQPGVKQEIRDSRDETTPAMTKSCVYQTVNSHERKWKIENYAPDCVFAGTTLFADNTDKGNPRIVEVNMQGRIVWEYKLSSEFKGSSRRKLNIIMDVDRQPNGNTLFVLREWGIIEVDRNGRTVWKHADEDASHDADRLPNGNTIYVSAWVAKGQDHMREVTADGKVVRSWNGLKDYDRPPFAGIEHEGWIHVNAVQSMANEDIFLSLRNFGVLARLAPDGRIVQEIALPLSRTDVNTYDFSDKTQQTSPHDPEYRGDGTIAVCLTLKNTLLVFNANTRQRLWFHSYQGGPQLPRDINILPNGNHLVVRHRFIEEITPGGQSVWRLSIPSIKQMKAGKAMPEFLFKAQRIGLDGSIHGN
jgi:hypothetical protein